MKWSIGVELELADVERDTVLPGRSTWDRKDYTIVNSNGVANDPSGKVWKFGGEINTEPTTSPETQAVVIAEVLAACRPLPAANYRTNFHVHVHVPGLADDLDTVKRVLRYTAEHGRRAFEVTDPIPRRPTPHDYPDEEALRGALGRWRRRRVSHHTQLTEDRLDRALRAETLEQVRAAHAPIGRFGRPQYHLAPRCGVNLRSLWETEAETVEFRHFCMSLDVEELLAAMRWCWAYLAYAIGGADALPLHAGPYPQQPLYDHWLETRYRQTSLRYRSEEEVRATLAHWAKEGILECTSPVYRQSVEESAVRPLFP